MSRRRERGHCPSCDPEHATAINDDVQSRLQQLHCRPALVDEAPPVLPPKEQLSLAAKLDAPAAPTT